MKIPYNKETGNPLLYYYKLDDLPTIWIENTAFYDEIEATQVVTTKGRCKLLVLLHKHGWLHQIFTSELLAILSLGLDPNNDIIRGYWKFRKRGYCYGLEYIGESLTNGDNTI